jgi:hypothetical protein
MLLPHQHPDWHTLTPEQQVKVYEALALFDGAVKGFQSALSRFMVNLDAAKEIIELERLWQKES